MPWLPWSRRKFSPAEFGGVVGGLDLTASRMRAARLAGGAVRRLVLDHPHADLPLAASLAGSRPTIGRVALAHGRRLQHLTAQNILPELERARKWRCGRRHYDASALIRLAFDRVRPVTKDIGAVGLSLPVYLVPGQVAALAKLADAAGLPPRVSSVTPLVIASGLALPTGQTGVVVDIDDHVLTVTAFAVESQRVRLLASATLSRLGELAWKERLIDALADRCVRQCHRDPRDSPDAEQSLFEQVEEALDRTGQGQAVDLTVRFATSHVVEHLRGLVAPDFAGFCSAQTRQAVGAVAEVVAAAGLGEPPTGVWLTHAAARLPGLTVAIHRHVPERTVVTSLSPDAVAEGAAKLADRARRGEIDWTHADTSLPTVPRSADGVDRRPVRDAGGAVPRLHLEES